MTRGYIPEVEMWDPMVTPCLDFQGPLDCYSRSGYTRKYHTFETADPLFKAALPGDSHAITHVQEATLLWPDSLMRIRIFPSLHGGGGGFVMDQGSLMLQAALSAHTMLRAPCSEFTLAYFPCSRKDRNLSPGS